MADVRGGPPNAGSAVAKPESPVSPPVDGRSATRASSLFPSMEKMPMRVTVELGRVPTTLGEVVTLAVGKVIVLEKSTGEHVDIRANDILVARGEVVAGGESFAVRVTGLVEQED